MKRNVNNMMNEFDKEQKAYDINDILDNNSFSSASNPFCTDPLPGTENVKKPKKHRAAKITAAVMAMALVSAGSIGIYSQFSDSSSSDTAVIEQTDSTSAKRSTLEAEAVSIIEPAPGTNAELSTEDIVDKALPSVVGIESEFTFESSNNGYYYGFGFGFNNAPTTQSGTATGTGVIITDDGYIVTNAHVIYDTEYNAGLADSISVLTNDGENYDAEVIGYDTDCDIAVLKINASDLTAAEFGDSDDLRLGESVIAIGNPLGFDLMDTVTAGIVSGLNRNITINDKPMTLLQTDAAINSGNSGGPLINKYGQVIGINSSKMSSTYGTASIEGIGFAIPSNEVSRIVEDIMEHGYVTGKPQLGISCQDVTENIAEMYNLPVGVYVTSVNEGSAAEKAGLRNGDVITAVDGNEVKSAAELTAQKNQHEAGDTITITYVRGGDTFDTELTLDENTND
jgi:serine protease Do